VNLTTLDGVCVMTVLTCFGVGNGYESLAD
jgi:hypothetical protein